MSERSSNGPNGAIPDPAALLAAHGDALFRYARLHLHDRSAAEDAVQETLLAALCSRKDFGGQSDERTWLIGILKHKLADHLRRATREQPASSDDASAWSNEDFFTHRGKWKSGPRDWGQDPTEALERAEFWRVFQECLSQLPSQHARAFALREMDGLSTTEIRQVLNITAANVWMMLHRARTRLRNCLEVNWFGSKA